MRLFIIFTLFYFSCYSQKNSYDILEIQGFVYKDSIVPVKDYLVMFNGYRTESIIDSTSRKGRNTYPISFNTKTDSLGHFQFEIKESSNYLNISMRVAGEDDYEYIAQDITIDLNDIKDNYNFYLEKWEVAFPVYTEKQLDSIYFSNNDKSFVYSKEQCYNFFNKNFNVSMRDFLNESLNTITYSNLVDDLFIINKDRLKIIRRKEIKDYEHNSSYALSNLDIDSTNYDFGKYSHVLIDKKLKKSIQRKIEKQIENVYESVDKYAKDSFGIDTHRINVKLIEADEIGIFQPKGNVQKIPIEVLRRFIKRSLSEFFREQEEIAIMYETTPIYDFFEENSLYELLDIRFTFTDFLNILYNTEFPKFYFIEYKDIKKLIQKDIWVDGLDEGDKKLLTIQKEKLLNKEFIDMNTAEVNKFIKIKGKHGYFIGFEDQLFFGLEDFIDLEKVKSKKIKELLKQLKENYFPDNFFSNEVNCFESSLTIYLYTLQAHIRLSMELQKYLIFTLSHELFHSYIQPTLSNYDGCMEAEYLADRFALDVYLKLFFDDIFQYLTSSASGVSDSAFKYEISSFLGKSIYEIFDNYFFESIEYSGNDCHPKISDRVKELKGYITSKFDSIEILANYKNFYEQMNKN